MSVPRTAETDRDMVRSTVHISGGSLAREPPEEIRSLGKHMTLPTTAEGSGGNRDNDHETRLPRARAYSGTFLMPCTGLPVR